MLSVGISFVGPTIGSVFLYTKDLQFLFAPDLLQ